jgi:MarR-like DNA-binding transcriptional regulator SgrR of sgrS sRNA
MAYVSQQDKKELAPAIKKVLSKYGMKGSISIRNHSTLQVTLQSGAIDLVMATFKSIPIISIHTTQARPKRS